MRYIISRIVILLLAVVTVAGISGCGKTEEPPTVLRLTSTPAGAEVAVNGTPVGVTPVDYPTQRGNRMIVKYTLAGHAPDWRNAVADADKVVEGKLAELRAATLITSQPAQAQVFLNGELAGETPLVLKALPMGLYRAELRKAGFAPLPVEWELAEGKPRYLALQFETNMGKLALTSEPDQARLFINGVETGTTPYEGELEEGQYQIKLTRDGFADVAENLVVTRMKQLDRHYKLSQLPGKLQISSTPEGASVFLDGELRGTTPLVIDNLEPRKYQLEISKDGYAMESTETVIAPGQTTQLSGQLVLATGGFDLDVEPNGVRVYLDNRELGVSDGKTFEIRDLEPGMHVIKVAHKWAMPEQQEYPIQIRKGEISQLPVLKIWIANAELTMRRDGEVLRGYIEDDAPADAPLLFSPHPGVRTSIAREKILSIKRLD